MISFYLSLLETAEDQQKFTQLYEEWEKKLYAIALQILKEPAQAEDALQQCWLKLIQKWEQVSALTWPQAGAYAVTAVKNCALDQLRKEAHTLPLPECWDPPAPEDGQEGYDYLVSLIQALPEKYRRVLEGKYIFEESNQEIGRRLKINASTVSTWAARGREILLEQLEKEGYTHEA